MEPKWHTIEQTSTLSLNEHCAGSPIAQSDDGDYYFFDETWTHVCGPFESYEHASAMLKAYGDSL